MSGARDVRPERNALTPESEVTAEPIQRSEASLESSSQAARADLNEAPEVATPAEEPQKFEFGVHGHVYSRDGSVVAGAQVSISIGATWMMPQRHRVTTDDLGYWSAKLDLRRITRKAYFKRSRDRRAAHDELRAQITRKAREVGQVQVLSDAELARLVSLAQPLGDLHWAQPLELEVRAHAKRKEQGSRSLTLSSDVPKLLRIDLILEELWDFSGETIFEGIGLPSANVLLFDNDWKYIAATLSDLEGNFHFNTPEPGRFRVHARKLGVGTGSTAGIYLGGPFPAPEIVVPIDGGWELLRGKLVLPDGESIAGVEVLAVEEGLALATPENPIHPTLSDLAQAEATGGLALSHARTGEDGFFFMPAMQPGAYLLELVGFADQHQPQETYRTGVENRIELDVNLLKVTVKTRKGELPLGLRVHVEEVQWYKLDPNAPTTHLSLAAPGGLAVFVVEPDKSWHVWASNGTEQTRKRRVRTSSHVRVKRVEIHVGRMQDEKARAPMPWKRHERPIEKAKLAVDLQDGNGRLQPCRLMLWSKVGDEWSKSSDVFYLAPGRFTRLIAPGDYLLVVHAADDESEFVLPTAAQRDEHRITLEAGAAQHIPMKMSQLEERAQLGTDSVSEGD